MFRDQRVFLQQFFRQYHTTGSVLPSSRSLANALCRFVAADAASQGQYSDQSANGKIESPAKVADYPSPQPSPARGEGGKFDNQGTRAREILEVGPGTGAVTARLVTQLRQEDRLTLVELNNDFVRHLHARFETEPAFQAVAARTQIVHARLEDLPGQQRFQVIISGLPLNNFAVSEVEEILGIFQRLLGPGGTLSFFEYIAIRRAKALACGREGRTRLRGIGQVLHRTLHGREIKRDWVWPNMPPAWVHHVRFSGT